MLGGLVLSLIDPARRSGIAGWRSARCLRRDAGRSHAVRACVVRCAHATAAALTAASSASSAWLLLSGVFWIAGRPGRRPGARRLVGAALSPSSTSAPAAVLLGAGTRPFDHRPTGTSTAATWPSAAHCSSSSRWANPILVTGATFAELPWNAVRHDRCFPHRVPGQRGDVVDLLRHRRGARQPPHRTSRIPAAVARNAYTYLHLLIVAGIIVCAVADELGTDAPRPRHRYAPGSSPRSLVDPRSTCSATRCSNG